MPAGKLRDRFEFPTPTKQSDGAGNFESGEWNVEFEDAAEQITLRGGEEIVAERLAGRQPTVLRVRQSSKTRQITTGWAARNKRTREMHNIKGKHDPDNKRMWFDILTETGGAVAV
jgi:head-tail adaptor